MDNRKTEPKPLPRRYIAMTLLLAVCLGAGVAGSVSTAAGVTSWYPTLQKPSFTPPSWLFGPVWTVLYVTMAMASWMVWRRGPSPKRRLAMWCFTLQLGLNLAWSWLFFGLRSPSLGLNDLTMLVAAIAATIWAFARINLGAALLLTPYLAWCCFAWALNWQILQLNG